MQDASQRLVNHQIILIDNKGERNKNLTLSLINYLPEIGQFWSIPTKICC